MADGDSQLEAILRQASEIAIPAIVLGEYRFGISQSRSQARYERWLADLLSNCRMLAVDQATAAHYAEIRAVLKTAGRPIPTNDLWIAALVLQHELPLLSRDAHFDLVPGLRRVRW